jgi:hypothetical protein
MPFAFMKVRMYYRLLLKEGKTMINMAAIQQVTLKGTQIIINYGSSVKGDFLGVRPFPDFQTFDYETVEKAEQVFEHIHEFVNKQPTQPRLG